MWSAYLSRTILCDTWLECGIIGPLYKRHKTRLLRYYGAFNYSSTVKSLHHHRKQWVSPEGLQAAGIYAMLASSNREAIDVNMANQQGITGELTGQ